MVSIISKQDPIAFKLKTNFYNFITFDLVTTDKTRLIKQLTIINKKSPNFFQYTSVVLNLETITLTEPLIDLRAIKNILNDFGISAIAVFGSEQYQALANLSEMAWLPSEKSKRSIKKEAAPKYKNECSSAEKRHNTNNNALNKDTYTKIVTQHIRSGQQIFSSQDLVILSKISEGAELLSENNIHIYSSSCKGRILAGIHGNTNARIFYHKFDAELISIAGKYKLIHNDDHWSSYFGKSVQIYLNNNELEINII